MIAAGARRSSRKAAAAASSAAAAAPALEKRSKSLSRPFFVPMADGDVVVGRWIASSSSSPFSSPLLDERERTTTTTTSGRALFGTSSSVSSSSSSNDDKNKSGSKTSDGSGAGDDGSKKGGDEAAASAAASSAAASTSKKAQDLLNAFRKQREKLRSDPRVKEAFSEAQKFKEEMKREVGMEKMFGKSEKEDAATSTSGKDASSASGESSSSGAPSSSSSSASTSTSKTSFIGRYFNVALEAIREEVRLLNMDEAEQFKEKRGKQREKEMRDYAAAAARDGDAPASTAVQIVMPKEPTRFELMIEDV